MNPRRNIPKAIKRVYVRILLFYIGGVTIIGLLVPSDSPELTLGTGNAAASPFVIAIKSAGINGLPSVCPSRLIMRLCPSHQRSIGHQRMPTFIRLVIRKQ